MSTTNSGPPVPFSSLPLSTSIPDTPLNAWGLYGDDDEKGFLNRQTDELVRRAAGSEIRSGKRCVFSYILGEWLLSTRFSCEEIYWIFHSFRYWLLLNVLLLSISTPPYFDFDFECHLWCCWFYFSMHAFMGHSSAPPSFLLICHM